MYQVLAYPAAFFMLYGMLSLDPTNRYTTVPYECEGCELSPAEGGPDRDSFDISFEPNPNPIDGQEHDHGECKKSIGCSPNPCTVNGTLTVTNNLGEGVHVHWRGENGGTWIEDGEEGEFPTGHVSIPCDGDKRIEIRSDGEDGPVKAFYDWDCTDCVKTADPN